MVATDKGTPAKSSTAEVVFSIADFNDNHPAFDKTDVAVSLAENVGTGTFCTRVTAGDKDIANSGAVVFEIASGNDAKRFAIDANTGFIHTVRRPCTPPIKQKRRPCPPIFRCLKPHFLLYGVVSVTRRVIPYECRKILEMLLKLMKLC